MKQYDVIIIGGSYAGLSAAMALGRSLRKVLVIDSANPCNRQSPYSHNFVTHDGEKPAEIAKKAKEQVARYDTVTFMHASATAARKLPGGFEIETESGEVYKARRLLFATGIVDIFPAIEGFAACWGISVLHCPYCHAYEVRQKNIGLIGNGDTGFELCRLICNWSGQITLFTNGRSTLTPGQTDKITNHRIEIVETAIKSFQHTNGSIRHIVFADGSIRQVDAVFARVAFRQHCTIPEALGCQLTEQGYIRVDDFHRTSVSSAYAAGDNTGMLRAVSHAVSAGAKTGSFINHDIIEEDF